MLKLYIVHLSYVAVRHSEPPPVTRSEAEVKPLICLVNVLLDSQHTASMRVSVNNNKLIYLADSGVGLKLVWPNCNLTAEITQSGLRWRIETCVLHGNRTNDFAIILNVLSCAQVFERKVLRSLLFIRILIFSWIIMVIVYIHFFKRCQYFWNGISLELCYT